MEKQDRTLQLKLWENCNNSCSFCYLTYNRKILSKEERRERIQQAQIFLKEKGSLYTKVGLIGGDFFQGQLEELWQEWIELLQTLNSQNFKQIWITATLTSINIDDLLKTLLCLRTPTLICTSWDAQGRFKNKEEAIWRLNLDRLHALGYEINVTSIITQDLLKADYNIPSYCHVNLCDPHLGLDWYYLVNKESYHRHLIEENSLFNLPRREDFLLFLRDHPQILKNYINYKDTHSDDIIDFNDRSVSYFDRCNNLNSNFINTCGHPYFSQCYADSDRCAMCDAEELYYEIF